MSPSLSSRERKREREGGKEGGKQEGREEGRDRGRERRGWRESMNSRLAAGQGLVSCLKWSATGMSVGVREDGRRHEAGAEVS